MAKVRFGSHEVGDGKHQPFISVGNVIAPDGTLLGDVEFKSDKLVSSSKEAREICMFCYLVLSSRQKNIQYSETGDIDL